MFTLIRKLCFWGRSLGSKAHEDRVAHLAALVHGAASEGLADVDRGRVPVPERFRQLRLAPAGTWKGRRAQRA